jgi:SAM-dependent methyltransferase
MPRPHPRQPLARTQALFPFPQRQPFHSSVTAPPCGTVYYLSGYAMAKRVCPWWIGYFLLNPFRRLSQDPAKILAPYVREGMTVLEPGPGMGYFTLELARMVGESGRVVVVDIQSKMLANLRRRAAKRGLLERIDARLAQPRSLGLGDLASSVDFALAFAMVHEMPDADLFFAETAHALKSGACLLLAEPRGHVKEAEFENELQSASAAGLQLANRPSIGRSHAALLQKTQGG